MKALDIVQTPKGGIALVTETNKQGTQASISWLGPRTDERNAWWDVHELEVVNSLPRVLALASAHPFGSGRDDVEIFFPKSARKETPI